MLFLWAGISRCNKIWLFLSFFPAPFLFVLVVLVNLWSRVALASRIGELYNLINIHMIWLLEWKWAKRIFWVNASSTASTTNNIKKYSFSIFQYPALVGACSRARRQDDDADETLSKRVKVSQSPMLNSLSTTFSHLLTLPNPLRSPRSAACQPSSENARTFIAVDFFSPWA